jgi:hypothetical protein
VEWINLAQSRDKWQAVVEHGNEFLGSIKCREFLEQLRK